MTLSRTRFADLADAFGGDLDRWPAEERTAALDLRRTDAEFAEAVLRQAGALDALLDRAPAGEVTAALVGKILAAAPQAAEPARWRRWLAPTALAVGLAGAALSGVLVGARLPDPNAEVVVAEEDVSLYLEEEA